VHRIDAAEGASVLLHGWHDPLEVDRLDHFPFLAAARFAART
jgi:hypothetical protein